MPPPPLPKFVLLIAGAGILWLISMIITALPPVGANTANEPTPEPLPAKNIQTDPNRKVGPPPEKAAVIEHGHKLLSLLQQKAQPAKVLNQLTALKSAVHKADPTKAATDLILLLEAGNNAPTGLEFDVAPEGVMAATSSYRSALLDLLGQTDPELSGQYSLKILEETGSQEEYALGMRNLGWVNIDGRFDKALTEAFRQMLRQPEWASDPEPAFLEAFDVATHLQLGEDMAQIISKPDSNNLIRRAAFVALDRMMLVEPTKLGKQLIDSTSPLSRLGLPRASLMSRLDLREVEQQQLLLDYLSQPVTAEELEYFAELFPNANTFNSHRLITGWEGNQDMNTIHTRDSVSLEVLTQWHKEESLSSISGYLEQIIHKLRIALAAGT